MDLLIRYLHLTAVLVLAGTLIIENMAMARQISQEDLRNLLKLDAAYGISAGVVLACGLGLWLWGGKPADFYSGNPVFHAKLGLFVLVGLLSIHPTVFLLRHRKHTQNIIEVPVSVLRVLRAELILLAFIPVLAFLMARGIGLPTP
jgi:putative membrane protein